MIKKIYRILFILIYIFSLSLFISCAEKKYSKKTDISINTKNLDSISVIIGKVKKLNPLLLPDTSANSNGDYSGIGSFCFVPPNRIFYLDTYFYTIKVISSETGRELFSFGKRGEGPGEFQPQPSLKYIDNYGLLTIDNTLLRFTLFDENGKVLETIKLKYPLSDFVFLDDSTALTGSFMLIPDYKPIKIISLKSFDVTSEFGFILEPQAKIIEKVNTSSFSRGKIEFFKYMSMVNLLLLPNKREFIYSQSQPLGLYKYNLENHSYIRFDAPLPFSTENNMLLEFDEENKIVKSGWNPSGKVMAPHILKNKIVVPIFSSGALTNYLDIYSFNGIFEKRFEIPPLPGLNAFKVVFNSDASEFYVIVGNQNRLFWIEKFQIDPSVFN